MGSYEDLRNKWRRLLEEDAAGCNFDLEKLAPGKFCVLYTDAGGYSMACFSEVQAVGVFEDARDFLAFLRFAEIPRVLDFDTGTNRDPFPDVADAYLLKYEGEQRDKIDRLIGLIDRSLKADMISASELSTICNKFNEAFSSTNPAVRILAPGRLTDILASEHFEEAFEDTMEEETDEDEKPATALRNLLDAGEFDENNEEHLVLARGFLERSIVVC